MRPVRGVLERLLWLYHAARDPATPAAAKLAIFGALAYLLFPLDVVVDPTPLVGLLDDIGVIAAAVLYVSRRLPPGVRERATHTLGRWFGAPRSGGAGTGDPS
jgi:uncharacterized membrane protein YkvA (DUF1232 family)